MLWQPFPASWYFWPGRKIEIEKELFIAAWQLLQIVASHLSQASSRSSQSQQQAATWLRSPWLFIYSQQHRLSSSSWTLFALFFMTNSCAAYQTLKLKFTHSLQEAYVVFYYWAERGGKQRDLKISTEIPLCWSDRLISTMTFFNTADSAYLLLPGPYPSLTSVMTYSTVNTGCLV